MVYNIKVDDTYGTNIGAIRDGKFKYIREAVSETESEEALFNLGDDEVEATDLAQTDPSRTARMRTLFDQMASSMVSGTMPPPIDDDAHVDENGYVRSGWCDV